MKEVARWALFASFACYGAYLLIWAYQSASFSVRADPILSEVYKTRALLLVALSVLSAAIGVLFLVCLSSKRVKYSTTEAESNEIK